MNLEQMKQFVALVKSGAQLKAYSKLLGISRDQLPHHLAKLTEYEKMIAISEEVVKKVDAKKLGEALGASIMKQVKPSKLPMLPPKKDKDAKTL